MKTGRLRLLNLLLIAALAFSLVAFVQPAQGGNAHRAVLL